MCRRFPINGWSGFVLSLILLAANVGAPFRTSTLGRTFLDVECVDPTPGAQVRVRAITHAEVALGFRAVVGISGGGPDAMACKASPRPDPAILLLARPALAFRQARPPAERPACPLRC
jgi:hypothetical protein